MKYARRILATALLALALAFLAMGIAVRRPLPPRTGTLRLPGLEHAVEIVYDARAVPHVRARTSRDAYRALGWLHAGDRFFQMEMRRRFATGRISEVLGPEGLPADVDARREDHARLAERDLATLDAGERTILEAYAEGVNGYLASYPRPLELVALGIRPETWTPRDSLAFGRLMNAFLSDAGDRERGVLDAIGAHGLDTVVEALAFEDGRRPHRPPLDGLGLTRLDETPSQPPAGGASNAFALAGSRTASGRPILGSDPHLPLEAIPVWYAAHLTSDEGLDVAGLTLAGLPIVVIGHNGRVAWGITMQQADDTDLFLERDAGASREETIAVRGRDAKRIVVHETPRGPVIGRSGEIWVARARAFRAPAASLAPFLGAARARDGGALAASFRDHKGPPVNVVWADADGHIGMFTAGAIPNRVAGDGRLPSPSWTGSYGWAGLRQADELPAIEDPAEGFVASGNDDRSLAGPPLPYPGHYLGGDRIGRLREVLATTTEASVEDLRMLQNDLLSPYARRVAEAIASMRFDDPRAEHARAVLAGWDARADLRGPSFLFYAAMIEARRAALGRRERDAHAPLPIGWVGLAAMITGDDAGSFWDDPSTPAVETRERVLGSALAAALTVVERQDGSDPASWNFGRRHHARFEHVFSSALPWLGGLLDLGPVEIPGEWNSPRVAGFSLRRGTYRVVHIQSSRMIVDLSDLDASRWVLPLGQSGQIGDRHRDDQLGAWAAGRDFPFPFTRAAVDAAGVSRVRLEP